MKFLGVLSTIFAGLICMSAEAISDDRLLIASGSYDPPHLGHMTFLIDAIERFEFHDIIVSIGFPYKKGSSNPEQVLRLTHAAVEDLDYVLRMRGIAFSDFQITTHGAVTWTNARNETIAVRSADHELKMGQGHALAALTQIQKRFGKNASQTYYVVGADSLINIQDRAHESVESWLNSAHWLVSARQSKGQNLLDMNTDDPLKKILPPEYYESYSSPSHSSNVVQYSSRSGATITLYSPENLPEISSSELRAALHEQKKDFINRFLQPRVRTCIELLAGSTK